MADRFVDLVDFLARHQLPDSFAGVANDYYVPLADWLHARIKRKSSGAFVLGINGAQGTGKTTLSRFLAEFLRCGRGLSVAELSIDDLYLTRAERAGLAQRVHPLLATRGVPGTHDVALGKTVIQKLCKLRAGQTMGLPRFNKLSDDRCPDDEWPEVAGPIDLVIFEGWCVGSTPQQDAELTAPVNQLEAEEDIDGTWRKHVNEQLAYGYGELFGLLDALVVLQAPGFGAIHRWRVEQERKLARSAEPGSPNIMDEAALARFIQHFERITRHNLASLPAQADIVLELDASHTVSRATAIGVG